MITTIVATVKPSVAGAEKGESEKIVAGPEAVLAVNETAALVLFGAKHPELANESPDRLSIEYRKGV